LDEQSSDDIEVPRKSKRTCISLYVEKIITEKLSLLHNGDKNYIITDVILAELVRITNLPNPVQ
jgi:hypothetical protein